MNAMIWPAAVSAGVALIGGIVSVVMWLRSKGEREEAGRQRREATRQAEIATKSAESAANALTEIAALQKQRDQRDQARAAAAERDPWQLQKLPDTSMEANLFNDSPTPKYCVNVRIVIEDDAAGTFAEKTIPFVGAKRPARIPYVDLAAPIQAIITWHLAEDCSDDPQTQTIEW
ncbi:MULTISPECIES: hypothetical protein [unclassified Mycolicibacterium]|uniref:hypothetical protein n=1 Tax=unclassified Mycolicibacterium TaxID=2636767 RepID=UPI002ED7B518